MCCDISNVDASHHNGSCCFGANAINLFSMGSKIGTATSITSSAPLSIPSKTAPSSSIITTSSSLSARLSANRISSIGSAPSSTSLSSSSAITSSVPDHSTTNGTTIGIAVGASVGAIMLIITIFLIYQHRRNRKKEPEDNRMMEPEKSDVRDIFVSSELFGQPEHEMPTGRRDLRPELPG